MFLVIVLITITLALRGLGLLGVGALGSWPVAVRGGLATMLVFTGFAHFSAKYRNDMIAMVPPLFPRPDLIVTATGILELAAVVGLLLPFTARWAALGVALLLVAMFPANVYAALHDIPFGGEPATPLVPRTFEQLFYLAACAVAALEVR